MLEFQKNIIFLLGLLMLALSSAVFFHSQASKTELALLAAPLLLVLLILYVTRPHVFLYLFTFAIPLLVGQEVVLHLNPGELATLLATSVGILLVLRRGSDLNVAIQRYRQILLPLGGLLLAGLLSSWYNSVTNFPEIVASIFKPFALLLILLVEVSYISDQRRIHGLIQAIIYGAGAVAFYSIFAYLKGWNYDPQLGYSRASGTFQHWNQLGGYMVLVSLPTLSYVQIVQKKSKKILVLLIFIAEIVALLLSLTIGSIIGLAAGILVASVLFYKLSLEKVLRVLFPIVAVAALLWVSIPAMRVRLSKEVIAERMTTRLATYQIGVNVIKHHFWFGVGSEKRLWDLIKSSPEYRYTSFGEFGSVPHNAFINIWGERGILGFLSLLILTINSFIFIYRKNPGENSPFYPFYQGVVASTVGFLLQNITNNLLLHARIGLIFFTLVATVGNLYFAEKEEKWNPTRSS